MTASILSPATSRRAPMVGPVRRIVTLSLVPAVVVVAVTVLVVNRIGSWVAGGVLDVTEPVSVLDLWTDE